MEDIEQKTLIPQNRKFQKDTFKHIKFARQMQFINRSFIFMEVYFF